MDVLSRWSMTDATTSTLDGGATNQTWRVRSAGSDYFLRRYRTTDAEQVRREHSLIHHAADAGIETPKPVPADDGSTVVDHGEAMFALFPAARGGQLGPEQLTSDHAASAGAFLGGLHNATRRFDATPFRKLTLSWDGPQWAERVRATAALIPREDSSEIDRRAAQRSADQAAWLDDPSCEHAYEPTSELQVIHGDYHHANLFFRNAAASAVIDWDTTVVMCRGFEVVRAASFMFQLEPNRTKAFVAGYRRTSDLSADELADGARAWGCFADHHVWPIEERYRHGNLAAERFIPDRPFEPFASSWATLAIT